MAAQQPPQRQPAAPPGAMPSDRLEAIGAAAGDEAAARAQQRRDPAAVELNQQQQQGGQRALPPGQGFGNRDRCARRGQGRKAEARGGDGQRWGAPARPRWAAPGRADGGAGRPLRRAAGCRCIRRFSWVEADRGRCGRGAPVAAFRLRGPAAGGEWRGGGKQGLGRGLESAIGHAWRAQTGFPACRRPA